MSAFPSRQTTTIRGSSAPRAASSGRPCWPGTGRLPERGPGIDHSHRRQELQRPRHPCDRRRQTGKVGSGQPQRPRGHNLEGRQPNAERNRQAAARYQHRHAQRRFQSPAHGDATRRPAQNRSSPSEAKDNHDKSAGPSQAVAKDAKPRTSSPEDTQKVSHVRSQEAKSDPKK